MKIIVGLGNPGEKYSKTRHNVGWLFIDYLSKIYGVDVSKNNWYKLEDEDILVIFDDIDIPFGTLRYREKGSGGSHNGMKNIVQMLSSQNMPRIRIGLGGLKHEKQDMADFVLQRFKKDELEKVDEVFYEASKIIEEFINKKD